MSRLSPEPTAQECMTLIDVLFDRLEALEDAVESPALERIADALECIDVRLVSMDAHADAVAELLYGRRIASADR